MFPTLIRLGGFRVATYGLLVAAGYLAGIQFLASRRERMELDEPSFWKMIYWLFFGAVLGGKVLYWAVEWRSVLDGSHRIFADFRYGFVFYGGFLGAALVGFLLARTLKRPFLALADYFAVALPVGHGIGRLGCLAAGCCAGKPTNLPWGLRFTHPDCLVSPELLGVPLHPSQLYEAAGNLVIAFLALRVLGRVERGERPHGSALAVYLAAYAVLRFLIEFSRGDDRGGALGLSVSQWISVCVLAASVFLYRFLKSSPVGEGGERGNS